MPTDPPTADIVKAYGYHLPAMDFAHLGFVCLYLADDPSVYHAELCFAC